VRPARRAIRSCRSISAVSLRGLRRLFGEISLPLRDRDWHECRSRFDPVPNPSTSSTWHELIWFLHLWSAAPPSMPHQAGRIGSAGLSVPWQHRYPVSAESIRVGTCYWCPFWTVILRSHQSLVGQPVPRTAEGDQQLREAKRGTPT
jgi:hypothetical protein